MGTTILGLDIGTNSIGWALLDCDDTEKARGLLASGVRIFQEAVDAKTRAPKNRARRTKRGMRRNLERRRRRVGKVRRLLMRNGFLPSTPDLGPMEAEVLNEIGDPYVLRARALTGSLSSYEFGRVVLQLAKRRGFLSNRKTKLKALLEDPNLAQKIESGEGDPAVDERLSDEEKKEQKQIAGEIKYIREEMKSGKFRTLGEYLASQRAHDPLRPVRRLHPGREMYEEEFQHLCEAQAPYHDLLRDPDFRVALHQAIFYQRPLRSQKFLVGKCQFEPTRRRAARARLDVQESRLLQDVNNIQVCDRSTGAYRTLDADEREKLLSFLRDRLKPTWTAVRKELDIHKNQPINLEESEKDLRGCSTQYRLRKILGDVWDSWTMDKQESLVEDLLTIGDRKALLRRLETAWEMPSAIAFELATLDLESGYGSLSVKATRAILPYLRAGRNYHDACQDAGYLRPDQRPKTSLDKLPPPPQTRNPVVQRALHEVRKVVNAVVRKFGKPAIIRVELARDLKLTAKDRERILKQNRENERLNKRAAEALAARGIHEPSHEDLLRYRLWVEGKETCPYTGRAIGIEQLFSGEVDIEHILPYSRTLDDSYMNKTLCFAEENRLRKKNKTPFEAYGSDAAAYEQILQQARSLPAPKRRKFEDRGPIEIDDFVARQLNDTRYASVAARDYLTLLGVRVQVGKGGATALLRTKWDLNRILSNDSSKNRGDHRHHAVDALVIALTDPGSLKRISSLSAARDVAGPWDRRLKVSEPWPGFEKEARDVMRAVIVSHAASRRLSGAFTEETAYGPTNEPGTFAYRKSVESLSEGEVERIRDPKVKERVQARLAEYGGVAKKAFTVPLFMTDDSKVPIRKVRLETKLSASAVCAVTDASGRAFKYLKLGNNHHVEIFEHVETGKRRGEFVSTIEAAERARRRKEPVVRASADREWKFVMSLAINDMIQVGIGADAQFYRAQKLEATNNRVVFRAHTAALLTEKSEGLVLSLGKFDCEKVVVDLLGEVTPSRN